MAAVTRERLDEARIHEHAISEWFQRRGWYVIRTCDFSGIHDAKAPMMFAPPDEDKIILPDLQMHRDGEAKWCEVKKKASADLYRKGGYLVTGFETYQLLNYERAQRVSGMEVLVVFLHQAEDELRGAPLDELGRAFSHHWPPPFSRRQMTFWKYDEIPLLCTLSSMRAELCL